VTHFVEIEEPARATNMNSYCRFAPGDPLHAGYHAEEYGFPQRDEAALFERLCLEIMQAGLSWGLVLRRRETMRDAFASYDIDRVAAMGPGDEARLLDDPGIIRNRLKVKAIISNAQRIKAMRETHGGFASWLDAHHPRDRAAWVKLFRSTFRFTGGEIVGEFLMSLGYIPGAHSETCPIYHKVLEARPAWFVAGSRLHIGREGS
jgi:DNA-3-methyladenine glycosylase I